MITLGEPSDASLRRRTSIKWARARRGQIPADIAELDFDLAPEIQTALQEATGRSDAGYPDFEIGTPATLIDVFAERIRARFGWQPNPLRTEVCAQIVQALCCALLAYTEPGAPILVHQPTYPSYLNAIRAFGRQCVTIPIDDLRDVADAYDGISRATEDRRIEMIVLCNPHNPTGRVLGARTLQVIGELADRENAIVFVDEVMQDLVHGGKRMASPGATDPLRSRSVIFTSAAKSFNLGGMRCAVGHFGSTSLHSRYCSLPWHLRNGASQFGLIATLAAWQRGDTWLTALKTRLEENLLHLAEALAGMPTIRWRPPDAGFLSWIDFSESVAALDPASHFRRRAGLILQPGQVFGSDYASFARLNFGTSAGRLDRVLQRLRLGMLT